MKKLILLAFMASIMTAPVAAIAQDKKSDKSPDKSTGDVITDAAKKTGEVAVDTVKTHPGKSAGLTACVVVAVFFPPAWIACGAAVVGGVGADVVKDEYYK
jgi:hypothetical protein